MNYKQIAGKFFKGFVFGAGSAVFALDFSAFQLSSLEQWKTFGIAVILATITGGLHAVWEIGRQIFGNS